MEWMPPYETPIGQVEIPIPRRFRSPPEHVLLTLFRVHSVDAKRPLSMVSERSPERVIFMGCPSIPLDEYIP